MKTPHQQRVEEFMRKAGQGVPLKPVVPDMEVRRLRVSLILEEALETIHALGFFVSETKDGRLEAFEHADGTNLVEIADGCADLSVVTIGTLSACGIHDAELLLEVDESNLRKFGPGSYRRDDGKWMKSPDWRPPNIKRVLKSQV